MANRNVRKGRRSTAHRRAGRESRPASPVRKDAAEAVAAPAPVTDDPGESAEGSVLRAEQERARLRNALNFPQSDDGDALGPRPSHAIPTRRSDGVGEPPSPPPTPVAPDPAAVIRGAERMVLDRLDELTARFDRLTQQLETARNEATSHSQRMPDRIEALLCDHEARWGQHLSALPAYSAYDDSAMVERLETLAAQVERLERPPANGSSVIQTPDQLVDAIEARLQSHEARLRGELSGPVAAGSLDDPGVAETLDKLTSRVDALVEPLQQMALAMDSTPRQMMGAVLSLFRAHETWLEGQLAAVRIAQGRGDPAMAGRLGGLAGQMDVLTVRVERLTTQLDAITPWFVEGPDQLLHTVEAIMHTHGSWLDEEAVSIRSWVNNELSTITQRLQSPR